MPNLQNRIHVDVEKIMSHAIRLFRRNEDAGTIKDLHAAICREVHDLNLNRAKNDQLSCPSYSVVYRRLGKMETENPTVQEKLTEEEISDREKAVCDFSRLDIILVDGETGKPLGRPWVSVIFNLFTGMIMGYHLGLEPPSFNSVMSALRLAVGTKYHLREKSPDIGNEWLARGLPNELIIGNGSAFKNDRLREACRQLGIRLQYSTTRFKPNIERHFQNLNNLIARLEKNSDGLDLEELKKILDRWIVDTHSVLKNRVSGIVSGHRRNDAKKKPHLSSEFALQISLKQADIMAAQVKGLGFLGYTYFSNELRQMLEESQDSEERHVVNLRYDSHDLSKIFIYDSRTQRYHEALLVGQEEEVPLRSKLFLNAIFGWVKTKIKSVAWKQKLTREGAF